MDVAEPARRVAAAGPVAGASPAGREPIHRPGDVWERAGDGARGTGPVTLSSAKGLLNYRAAPTDPPSSPSWTGD